MIDTGYFESPSVSGGKYWRYQYDPTTRMLTVSWGKLGANPQMRRKQSTQDDVDKLVRSKLAKGYRPRPDPLGATAGQDWTCSRCNRLLTLDTLRIWRLGSASGIVCTNDVPKVGDVEILTYDEAMSQAAIDLDDLENELDA